MNSALEYMGASEYYEKQARDIDSAQERLTYAVLAAQQATLAVAAATIEQTAAIREQTVAIREAAETGVRVVND